MLTCACQMLADSTAYNLGIGGLNSQLGLLEKYCSMRASWMITASDAGLLLSACTKFAGDMAALVLGLDVPLMAIQLERILHT
jgi:hypothetical protein